jgi:hypothetical protein
MTRLLLERRGGPAPSGVRLSGAEEPPSSSCRRVLSRTEAGVAGASLDRRCCDGDGDRDRDSEGEGDDGSGCHRPRPPRGDGLVVAGLRGGGAQDGLPSSAGARTGCASEHPPSVQQL